MAYERFVSKSVRRAGPFLSMRPDGRIRFNLDATNKLLSLGISRLDLLWDKANGRLAFRAAASDDGLAYKLSVSRQQNSADVSVRAFIKYIGLSLTEKVDLPLEWNGSQKMFEAKLPHEVRRKSLTHKR